MSLPSHVVIVGAGYTGQRLATQLLQESSSCEIWLTSRNPSENLQAFQDHERVHLVELDLLSESLAQDLESIAFPGPDTWVVYSAPTLYRTYEPEPLASGVSRHVQPLAAVSRWCQACAGFIYLSSTSVYGDHQGDWVDEESERRPESALGKMRRDLEDYVLTTFASRAPHSALNVARIVGIYGPGRTLLEYIQRGRYKLVDGGEKITNRVHVDDIVRALLAMMEHGKPGAQVYNVSDGHPLSVRELVDFLVENQGITRPEEVSLEEYAESRGPNVASRWKTTYCCKNNKLRDTLGWEPQYKTALEGLAAIHS